MADLFNQYVALLDGVKISLLMALIVANFLTGIAVAIKTNSFRLKEMGDFLRSRILPYVVAYLGMGIIGVIDSAWAWAVTAVWAVILATLIGAILQNLKELGIKLPDSLTGN